MVFVLLDHFILCVCFVDRCLSFWQLCCQTFDLQILITPLVSSNSSSDVLMEGNVDWPKVVFQQSMDDLLFILDTMFAKSITPHVSTNTQQQMTFHLITYHKS